MMKNLNATIRTTTEPVSFCIKNAALQWDTHGGYNLKWFGNLRLIMLLDRFGIKSAQKLLSMTHVYTVPVSGLYAVVTSDPIYSTSYTTSKKAGDTIRLASENVSITRL